MLPPRTPKVDLLRDEFGQYSILLKCECGHSRYCHPSTLANIVGWDAKLVDVVKRMRCSECGQRKCIAEVHQQRAPRVYKPH